VRFEEARAEFPVLGRTAYLNAGTFGPLARGTVAAMRQQDEWELQHGRGGKPYYDELHALRERVRAQLAEVLGATAEHIAITGSTTDACHIAVAGLRLAPEAEIVTTDAEHFGLVGPVFASGARVNVAHVGDLARNQLLDAILQEVTPRTKLLALSHVLWTTGHVVPVHDLKRLTGLPVIVDGAQSAGAIPVELGDLDFYTVSAQKWLCGPAGTGALYVRDPEALAVARPNSLSQESFEPTGRFVPKPGAARFDSGWVSGAALRGLSAALELAPEWRFDRLRQAAARSRDALAKRVDVVTAPNQAGLVTFRVGGDPATLVARLLERGVVIRNLPGTDWARASCGWWTNDEDVWRLVDAL